MNSKVRLSKIASTRSHSNMLKRSLLTDLVNNGHLTSTRAKIKTLVPYFERVINYATSKNERIAEAYLNSIFLNNKATSKVLNEYKEMFKDSKGGYLRVFKLGNRKGDNAPMQKVIVKGYNYKEVGMEISLDKKSKASITTTDLEQIDNVKVEDEIVENMPVSEDTAKNKSKMKK